ncbi:MAG: lathosterol oxidase [Parasphingorhabdus sp.]|jgi:lathosterol oxidase
MTSTTSVQPDQKPKKPARKVWNWHPELPIQNTNVFSWPPNPLVIIKTLIGYWTSLTGRVFILATALLSWALFQPLMVNAAEFQFHWIAHIYVRNLLLIVLLASGLHAYFYTYKKQGMEYRFDAREMARGNDAFTFRNQLLDNIFWSIASGVTIWTTYEVLFIWGFANELIPYLAWQDNPFWFVAIFILVPIWYSFYFYWVHRAEHWPRIYKKVHALHHRNINVGPWSGLSMHPVEHLFYLASPAIHLVLPSHPMHVIFHLQFTALAAVISHTGYQGFSVKGKCAIEVGYFFHQLHHRFFDCNYGTDEMPWDKWLGTFHDGLPETTEIMRQKKRHNR